MRLALVAVVGLVATVAEAARNTQVGTVKSEGKMLAATFVQETSLVVVHTHRHSAEGCDGGPEAGIYVMPIK